MKRLDIIPMPNKVTFLGGQATVKPDEAITEISPVLGEEEYILTVEKDGIKLIGGSERALFYGRQTLSQLSGECPCVKIED